MSDPHREYCDILSDEIQARQQVFAYDDQVAFTEPHDQHLNELSHIQSSNCRFQNLPYELSQSPLHSTSDMADLRPALLQFMVAATPKDEVVADILENFDKHMDNMVIRAPVAHFAPNGSPIEIAVSNVPDTVNPVKARLAYVQVPSKNGDTTHLAVVWKVCRFHFFSPSTPPKLHFFSSKSRCKTTGMRPPSLQQHHTALFPW